MKLWPLLAAALAWAGPAAGTELLLSEIPPPQAPTPAITQAEQLPHSHVARGTLDIASAWLARPTGRYDHGVLGDSLEAARLSVQTASGQTLHLDLPAHRVFEDLVPRLADLDRDGHDEILVVESDVNEGSALAVYGLEDARLVLRGRTPFIGRAHRWLNPVGAGDFDGDGQLELALVATPHIGGILRLYRYAPPAFPMLAETDGVSTHRMGSTELGLGQIVRTGNKTWPRDRLLLPDQMQRSLLLLEWTPGGLREVARTPLPARLRTSLHASGDRRWRFELDNRRHYEIRVID